MAQADAATATDHSLASITEDWSGDRETFHVPWGKAMMWIFLLSDTFIFSCFLVSYMNVRMSTTVQWPPRPSTSPGMTISPMQGREEVQGRGWGASRAKPTLQVVTVLF